MPPRAAGGSDKHLPPRHLLNGGGNAPKARSVTHANRKGSVRGREGRGKKGRFTFAKDTVGSKLHECIRTASRALAALKRPGWRPLGSANTPCGKANRLERGDTFAETERRSSIFALKLANTVSTRYARFGLACPARYVAGTINNRTDLRTTITLSIVPLLRH